MSPRTARGARLWYHRPVVTALACHGFRVHAYTFAPELYTRDVTATRRRMIAAAAELASANTGEVVVGLSLGADLAFKVAANDPAVRTVIAIGTGFSFARSAWNNRAPSRKLCADGWTLARLEPAWRELGAGHNLNNAATQRFYYGYSTRDSIIGNNNAALADALHTVSLHTSVRITGAPGHALGIAAALARVADIARHAGER